MKVIGTVCLRKQKETLNMHYVLLEGVFSSGDRGHEGMWSGSVKRIRRAELWPVNHKKG
jgi:hypothetical protein